MFGLQQVSSLVKRYRVQRTGSHVTGEGAAVSVGSGLRALGGAEVDTEGCLGECDHNMYSTIQYTVHTQYLDIYRVIH